VSRVTATPRATAGMRVVYGVVFVDLLGFSMILPVLPFHVSGLGGDGTWLGVVLAGYSLGQVVAAPVLGRLSDRFGRRPLLLLALAGSTASLALAAVAEPLWLLFGARVLAGVCGGSIGVANAYAADLAPAGQLQRVMGNVGAAIGTAFMLGPALGALLAPRGFAAVTLAAAGIALVNLTFAWVTLPHDTRPAAAAEAPAHEPAAPGRGSPPVALLAAVFATTVAFVAMETVLAPSAQRQFGAGPAFVGWLLAAAGACLIVVQAGLAGRLRSLAGGVAGTGAAGALAMAVGLGVLPFAPVAGFVAAILLISAGYALVTPSVTSLLALAGADHHRGARLGAGQSAAAAGRLCGPVLAGVLLDLHPGVPQLAAAGFALAAAAALARRHMPR
jgi:DHA1 family tetracycline resistance protein-like MFS transporter